MGFRLNWDDNNLAEDGHRVYRDTAPMDPEALPAPLAELGPNVTSWDDTDVEPSTTYYYRVAAVMGDVQAVSAEVQVTSAGVLQPPTNVVVELVDAGGRLPSVIGEEFGGGYYIGNIVVADGGADDGEYAVIMAGPEGEAPTLLAWKDPRSATPGTDSATNGLANTQAMEAADPAIHYAGMYCLNYDGGGFEDWYLPSFGELTLAKENLALLSGLEMNLTPSRYWSSTQNSSVAARAQIFGGGTQNANKDTPHNVRPVRRILIPQE